MSGGCSARETVQRRARDGRPSASVSISAASSMIGPRATVDEIGGRLHQSQTIGIQKAPRQLVQEAGDDDEIGKLEKIVEFAELGARLRCGAVVDVRISGENRHPVALHLSHIALGTIFGGQKACNQFSLASGVRLCKNALQVRARRFVCDLQFVGDGP